jgi:hypothetical protein
MILSIRLPILTEIFSCFALLPQEMLYLADDGDALLITVGEMMWPFATLLVLPSKSDMCSCKKRCTFIVYASALSRKYILLGNCC